MTLKYEVVTSARTGQERVHAYASNEAIRPRDVLRLQGRDWLVVGVEDGEPARAIAKPARYRLRLHHPDGSDELGAFRRYRPDGPRLGHAFTTIEAGLPVSWEVVDEDLASDEEGEPFLEFVAERDYSELEELPNHELEHALARREAEMPDAALATVARAQAAGLAVELVALDPGEEPDWEAARSYVDALILEEIEDDLLELCGVNPARDPREAWLAQVKERLQSDLAMFRADIERNHDEIEEWEFRDGRIFASVGSMDDEANPDNGHGWMTRLVDSGALTAAGFARVRKADLAAQ